MGNVQKTTAGFTLIELMIVVAIVSILAAIAIPEFYQFLVKSKRAEAHQALGTLATAETAFKAEKDYFTLSLLQLGFELGAGPTASNLECIEGAFVSCGKFYAVYVPIATSTMFVGQAWGRPDAKSGLDTFVVWIGVL